MKGSRRPARVAALQSLYEIEVGRAVPSEALGEKLGWDKLSAGQSDYADRLVYGVLRHQAKLETLISAALKGYTLERLAIIDRAVLKLAAYELILEGDVPTPVVIDEAVTIVKRFSTAESGRFVNGVLAAIAAGVERPATTEQPSAEEPEPETEEPAEEAIEIEEIEAEADSPEVQAAQRAHGWRIREEG